MMVAIIWGNIKYLEYSDKRNLCYLLNFKALGQILQEIAYQIGTESRQAPDK